tara:strand:- start:231 stop:1754 length:1524 start_codon:yes stop_codon:yes gene_type:complete
MKITNDDVKYVIVQAGGKGTRMGHFAENKPKCLVSVNDIPMIVNTLNVYKDKEVIIIADYKADVLEKYLKSFYKGHNYWIHHTTESGTAGGLKKAVSLIPDKEPFILTWADLFFEKENTFSVENDLLVGLSNTFKCRWKLNESNKFVNEASTDCGVAGFFVFRDKSKFNTLKIDKSLVRGFLTDNYSSENIDSFYLNGCFEVGEIERYEELLSNKINHRFFNEIKIDKDTVYKNCIDSEYDEVHQNEKDWYQCVSNKFKNIPKLYSIDPLILERINGKHLWEVDNNKDKIISNYCDALGSLHIIKRVIANTKDSMDVYFTKAYNRISEVKNVIPFIKSPIIKINGKECMNPYVNEVEYEKSIASIIEQKYYNVIHGDATFSNTLVDSNNNIWLIDPRGSFGSSKIYGDHRYDWAKFYYSAVGNYDSINSKKYRVIFHSDEIELQIKSNGYEDYSNFIIDSSGMSKKEMGLIHASIWLSLTGYVREDYDAILYSFYRGCQLWTEALSS